PQHPGRQAHEGSGRQPWLQLRDARRLQPRGARLPRRRAVNVAGKLALVTGAASGIGRETALALARAGADLVVCDVNEAALAETAAAIRGLGRSVLARRVDVARRDDMQAFATEVHRQHQAVDVLVNNAGVGLGGGVLDTSLE